jgi:transcriptional/translational regulatory protein YebC/TACO1
LADSSIPTQSAEITKIPGTTIKVDEVLGEKVLRLMDHFEDHEDVQQVFSNFEMSDEVMAKLS